ncbi:hypothetical protein [Nocardia sp. NPDC049149]|uniref:hypothetical protein n=1 Tax=Nocardia sp. NPDC049149 TaxID=3364315 RepID=UPI00370FEFF3
MTTESNSTATGAGAQGAGMHMEYLYGPQWRDVVRIIERAAQLTDDERAKLKAQAEQQLQSQMAAMSGAGGGLGNGLGGGLANLLSGLGQLSNDSQPAKIAAETAKEFGRTRNVQVAGMVAGQAVSSAEGVEGQLAGLLGSLSSLTTVSQAATAAVLGDLIGQGKFTQEVYDALMTPWSSSVS